jgi:hypothetical protein
MVAARTSGYSGTPLSKKLGLQPAMSVYVWHAPAQYLTLLAPVPSEVRFTKRLTGTADLAHVFVTERRELGKQLTALRRVLQVHVPLWISWPKKSSGVRTDITEDTIRELALPLGFVDIKVCAVDDTWSGLKLVVRKELR